MEAASEVDSKAFPWDLWTVPVVLGRLDARKACNESVTSSEGDGN
jgi:hypothetical protein